MFFFIKVIFSLSYLTCGALFQKKMRSTLTVDHRWTLHSFLLFVRANYIFWVWHWRSLGKKKVCPDETSSELIWQMWHDSFPWQTSYCKFIITILKWNVWNQQQNCEAAVFVVSCSKNWLQQTGSLRPVICPILSKLAHSESAALVSHSFGHSSIAAQLYFHTRLSLHHSRPVQPVHITTSLHEIWEYFP